jgi:hypothetical protein
MSGLAPQKASAAGKTAPLLINLLQSYGINAAPAWALGIVVTVSPGASLTYQIEISAEPQPSAAGNWNAHDTLQGLSASANGNVSFPITALRINVLTYSSGSVSMAVAMWP